MPFLQDLFFPTLANLKTQPRLNQVWISFQLKELNRQSVLHPAKWNGSGIKIHIFVEGVAN